MCSPTIYTLIMAIRGFSNEVTVRALASQLGISYSTLARCKNGVWPRSITFDAMSNVLSDCRDQFFDGNENSLARSLLRQFQDQGIDPQAIKQLQTLLHEDGYEAFESKLFTTLRNANVAKQSNPDPVKQDPIQIETVAPPPQPQPLTTVEPSHDALFAIPFVIILLLGMFKVSLADFFVWADANRLAFLFVSLLLALLPALAGALIDAPLAWHKFKRAHPDASFSHEKYVRVAKYGAEEGLEKGAGRVDLAFPDSLHQPICNVCGALFCISMFTFLLTLPGFSEFLLRHDWIEFFKAGICVAFYIAYDHARDQGKATYKTESYNPDNYLPTRFHMWGNIAHLVWTISLSIVLLLSFIAYSMVNQRIAGMPALVVWPFLQGMGFFACACTSKSAERTHSTSVGILLPGVLASSAGFSLLAVTCYLPSWGTVLLCAVCVLCTFAAFRWTRAQKSQGDAAWLEKNKRTQSYSIAMAATVFVLFVVGIITSAFV